MPNNATLQVSLQYTPPNAAANSGNVAYTVVSPYNAQNVGQFDVLSTETAPITNNIPFGSVSQCLMLIIQNGQATDIGVKINGGITLAGVAASITVSSAIVTLTGLSGMLSAAVGDTITIIGATTSANNGTFPIASILSNTSVVITNVSGATDGASGSIKWILNQTVDNFRIPSKGCLTFAAPANPLGTPMVGSPLVAVPEYILSATVVSYGVPGVGNTELISYFVFGN